MSFFVFAYAVLAVTFGLAVWQTVSLNNNPASECGPMIAVVWVLWCALAVFVALLRGAYGLYLWAA